MKTAHDIRTTTGGYINAAPLMAVSGVREAFSELLKRVQALTFVPSDWTSNVNAAMDEAGDGAIWLPAYAIVTDAWRADQTSPLYPETPTWISATPNAPEAWNTLVDWWANRLQPILSGWARDEAETLAAAVHDAAFWNRLYAIVKPVAVVGEVILAAPEAVAGAAADVAGGVFKKLLPVLIVVGVAALAVLIYKRKMTA